MKETRTGQIAGHNGDHLSTSLRFGQAGIEKREPIRDISQVYLRERAGLITSIGEIHSRVGTPLGSTNWITIDQNRIDMFANATDDWQWIHVDRDRAKAGPFGTTIAHGYLTMSLASKFLLELLVVNDAQHAINYGVERARFLSPVPVGSAVRGNGNILSVKEVPGGVQTTTTIAIELRDSGKPAAVADVMTRFLF